MKKILMGCLFVGACACVTVMAGQYEPGVVLDADEVLGRPLSGTGVEINQQVENDGRFNHFSVRFNGQETQITTSDWLAERLHEEDAIGILREIKQTNAYKKGLDAALEAPLALTRNTLNDPIATIESIPQGISNLFQDIGSAVSSAGSGQGKGDNALVKDLIGFNKVKRRLALELGVDAYSSNEILQQELDDVAWSMFAGGAVIDVTLAAAPLVASLSVKLSEQANTGSLSWRIPPSTLQQAMVRSVRKQGLTETEIEELVFHKTCTLTHLSSIVTNMEALGPVEGIDSFYRQVARLDTELDCRVHQKTAMLLYLYHNNIEPLQRIDVDPQFAQLLDKNRSRVMVLVADHLAYRPESVRLFNSARVADAMWISGQVSPYARQQLDGNIMLQQAVTERFKAPLDIVAVLMPERAADPVKEGENSNRTRDMVDGVGDVVTGVLGTLTSPLTGEQSQQGPSDAAQ
jgi:hypothetical protein